METVAIVLYGGGCFALGMYVTTQISHWIDGRITKQNETLRKNMEAYDKQKNETETE